MCLMYISLHGTTLGVYTYLGYMTLEKCNMILTHSEHWLLLNNSMSMCEVLSGIYELLLQWSGHLNKNCKTTYEYFLTNVFMHCLNFIDPDPLVFCNIKSL